MNKLRTTGFLLAMCMLLSAGSMASEYYPAFLVLRYFDEGSEGERERLESAHREYYLNHGREAASFRIMDDHGEAIGRGSWMAFRSEDAARAFVANDPYSLANLYSETSVDKADLYLLDTWFSIAPSWRSGNLLEKVYERYDSEVIAEPVPER